MFPDPHSETIEVRPDEGFDVVRLREYLTDKLEGANRTIQVRQFSGGAANLTYLLICGEHEYVLRRPPLGPVAPSAHDMGREYQVLSVLHQSFPYAPVAHLYCEDPDIIGAPFLIMERRRGVVVRRNIPKIYADNPKAARQMSKALIDALVAFHAVDYEAIGLGSLGKPDGFVLRQVEGWNRRWHKAKTHDLPDMNFMYEWLLENLPETQGASLVHNDYKLDNIMLAKNDPAEIIAVFDWDMCTLGDPLCDLGTLLTYWSEPDDPSEVKQTASMPVGDDGFMTRQELIHHYAEESGTEVSHINYYYALGIYRLTIIIAQIYVRYARGQTQDSRFAGLGELIPLFAHRARQVAEGVL